MFFLFSLVLFLYGQQALSAELTRAGWIEKAMIYPHEIVLQAKLDTGAKTSSLHAPDPEFIMRDGEEWVRISVTNRKIETVMLEAPVVRDVKIKRHFGDRQIRKVVLLDLCIGNVRKREEVNLVDRTGFNYQLLVGRNFLKNAFLIDSGSTYLLSTDCSG